jgi:hypothetical protein
VPGLYAQAPPASSFPREMVDSCPEGAGGGNVRHFICGPDGTVTAAFSGYWKPARFLRELGPHDHAADPDGTALEAAQKARLERDHREAPEYVNRPLRENLSRIAEEVYTKGKTG